MFQRRLLVFSLIVLAAMGILIARLAWIQLHQGEEYLAKIRQLNQNRQKTQWLNTVRGSIYDMQGNILAQDQLGFKICLAYQMTRLYDMRYRLYLRYCAQDTLHLSVAGARLKVHEDLDAVHQQADQMLYELAQLNSVPIEDIYREIEKLNNRIFNLQLSRARRIWYDMHDRAKFKPLPDIEKIQADFKKRVPLEKDRLKLVFAEAAVVEMYEPQPILNFISPQTALKIEERFMGAYLQIPHLKHPVKPIIVQSAQTRQYPFNEAACHIIGQLDPVPESMISLRPQKTRPTMKELEAYYLGDRMGAWGMERMFEKYLRGRRGWQKKDNQGRIIEKIERVMGGDVTLTIDIELQKRIQAMFRQYKGAAVIIDVPSGQVRAMVSVPVFDLNTYYLSENYHIINDPANPDLPRLNRALSKNYQTGSTIKPTIMLGGLEYNIVTPQTIFNCSLANKDWSGKPDKIHNHGPTTSRKAVKVSCNFYFIHLGLLMGPERLTEWLKKAGFGRRILAWPDAQYARRAAYSFRETAGFIKPLGTAFTKYYQRFVSIGLNPLSGSVLQMANSTATIARNGIFVHPSLVLTPGVEYEAEQIASFEHAKIVQEGMADVINEPDGTAFDAFYPLPWPKDEVELFGKTGSSGTSSLFVCYAKVWDGRCLALAVVVEVPEDGSVVAAPLARRILIECGKLDYLPSAQMKTLPAGQ